MDKRDDEKKHVEGPLSKEEVEEILNWLELEIGKTETKESPGNRQPLNQPEAENMFEISEEEMFSPLQKACESLKFEERETVMSNYMYMGLSTKAGKDSAHHFAYKHYWTRLYVHIECQSGKIISGDLDAGCYEPDGIIDHNPAIK
ncbi:hypothetical protein [Paenibacillus abyssi]|uniref:hypothetical protein n=1 Tax=Paenibacillus abyssi TaxID=1340531 RepID=UPI00166A0B4F|nr:hypothetical protein [Paenibacillus abyssi]